MKHIQYVECSYMQCWVKTDELYLYESWDGGTQEWMCADCMNRRFKEWAKKYIRPENSYTEKLKGNLPDAPDLEVDEDER